MLEGPDAAVVDALREVWASTASVCEGIGDEAWELATECPGWTVRDQLSHLIGIERALLGDPAPSPDRLDHPHVKNAFGEANEAWVAARRHLPGTEVLAEFVEVTGRRLEALSSMTPERFDEVGWSPVGQVPYREFMVVRAFDCWVHEQDVRRALGRPGGTGGAGETITLDRMAGAMGYVVGRKVGAPEGTTVVWRITGDAGRDVSVVVADGRGITPEREPKDPDVLITLGSDVFWRLACGRVSAEVALRDEGVTVVGDADLARRIVEDMSVVP